LDSLSRKAPTEEEREIIHEMFIKDQQDGITGKSMADCSLKTVFICHPQVTASHTKCPQHLSTKRQHPFTLHSTSAE